MYIVQKERRRERGAKWNWIIPSVWLSVCLFAVTTKTENRIYASQERNRLQIFLFNSTMWCCRSLFSCRIGICTHIFFSLCLLIQSNSLAFLGVMDSGHSTGSCALVTHAERTNWMSFFSSPFYFVRLYVNWSGMKFIRIHKLSHHNELVLRTSQ